MGGAIGYDAVTKIVQLNRNAITQIQDVTTASVQVGDIGPGDVVDRRIALLCVEKVKQCLHAECIIMKSVVTACIGKRLYPGGGKR